MSSFCNIELKKDGSGILNLWDNGDFMVFKIKQYKRNIPQWSDYDRFIKIPAPSPGLKLDNEKEA